MNPVTAEQMTHDEMVQTAKTHSCGQCGGPLNVAWSAETNGYVLRCRDLTHDTITRHAPKSEHELTHEREWRRIRKMDTVGLMKMDNAAMMTRVGMAKFPQDLTDSDKRLLAEVAITYGLDPLMGEVSIYQGRPYVSIDGRYRKAQETGKLDGVASRPATKQERTEWEIPSCDFFFRTEIWHKDASHPFVAWGRVFEHETEVPEGKRAFLPTQTNPQRMAEKRAEAQGLRKAFHIDLPSIEDIGFRRDGRMVDTSTGEVIDVKAKVVEGNGKKPEDIFGPDPDKVPDEATLAAAKAEIIALVRKNVPTVKTNPEVRDWLVGEGYALTDLQTRPDLVLAVLRRGRGW